MNLPLDCYFKLDDLIQYQSHQASEQDIKLNDGLSALTIRLLGNH